MLTYRSFAARLWRGVVLICIALLICSSAGCGKRAPYVAGGHKLTRLDKGQAASQRGVLMSEEYLAQIFETLGEAPPAAKAPACKTCPPLKVKGTTSETVE